MTRVEAIIRVLDKRAARGATDKSLISWLMGLKRPNAQINNALDGLIDAIQQTPDGGMK